MAAQDLEQQLMRRVVDGIVGWATYRQACASGRHYDEHAFYEHIEQIARGRNWRVSPQHKIKQASSGGAPSTVDFVIYRTPDNEHSREALLFVEVKYLRGDNPSQDVKYLIGDIKKLRPLQSTDLLRAKTLTTCGTPAKFLLILGQRSGLDATVALNARTEESKKVVTMLRQAHGNTPPDSVYWADADTYLSRSLEWKAIAISSRRWPI